MFVSQVVLAPLPNVELASSLTVLFTLALGPYVGYTLAVFVLLVIFYTAGVDQWACIGFGAGAASMLVFYTFRMNARYGEHGLMKLAAARRRPRYLINRKGACRFLNRRKEVRHA